MSSDGGRERPAGTPPNSTAPSSTPDLRLGRRPTSLVGTVIPPAILVTLSTIFWFGPVAEWISLGPILLLLVGWTASEFGSWRCNVDVRRGRLSSWAYAADWIALGAYGLAFAGDNLAALVSGATAAADWRRFFLVALVFGIALRSMLARRRRALALVRA